MKRNDEVLTKYPNGFGIVQRATGTNMDDVVDVNINCNGTATDMSFREEYITPVTDGVYVIESEEVNQLQESTDEDISKEDIIKINQFKELDGKTFSSISNAYKTLDIECKHTKIYSLKEFMHQCNIYGASQNARYAHITIERKRYSVLYHEGEYVKDTPERDVAISHFSDNLGYDDEDREELNKMEFGDTVVLDYGRQTIICHK